jgi:predicted amidohydrolase
VRALLAQLTPAPGLVSDNAARAARTIRSNPQVDLVVFPELFLSGYRARDLGEVACDGDSRELDEVAEACASAGSAAIVGFVERDAQGFRNAAACIDRDGSIAAIYRKAQLFGEEAEAFAPGEWLLVVELAGRAVAPLICFDVEFPELARATAMAGADLLVTVAANMEPFAHDHRVHAAARALENRIPHLYVNRGGSESGFDFVGESRALRADGTIDAEATGDEELLEVEVGPSGSDDDRVDYLSFEPSRLPVEVRSKSLPG